MAKHSCGDEVEVEESASRTEEPSKAEASTFYEAPEAQETRGVERGKEEDLLRAIPVAGALAQVAVEEMEKAAHSKYSPRVAKAMAAKFLHSA
jgi:hypothetical protein